MMRLGKAQHVAPAMAAAEAAAARRARRRMALAAIGTALTTSLPTGAEATTYMWSAGTYMPGATSPNPLYSGDFLSLVSSATKTFGTTFTNASGEVDWLAGDVRLIGGAQIFNNGVWAASGDDRLFAQLGGGTFTNAGVFRKTAGNLTVISVPFVNSGTIDAASGQIHFDGGATFNSGTSFTGAGTTFVAANASFNGAISSTNLSLEDGTFTGTGAGATLSGAAKIYTGGFAGIWSIASGSTLDILALPDKTFAGSFTNNGTVKWSQGDIRLESGGVLTNNGVWQALDDDGQLVVGAGSGTFVNAADGVFRKTGIGLTTIIAPFVNSGTIDAASGQIHFDSGAIFNDGTRFIGVGKTFVADASFNGAISSTNLNFADGTYTGTGAGATLSGSATIFTGGFDGIWSIASGSTLDIRGLPGKSIAGSFTNDGTVNWFQGDLGISAGGVLTNNGTMSWSVGDLQLADGANLINTGLWVAAGNSDIREIAGGGTFTNSGVFRKTGGGLAVIDSPFVNSGTIDAAAGDIHFDAAATFNDGTSFIGTGLIFVADAAFNGAISSANLKLADGTYTGTGAGATLSGSATVYNGSFAGSWSLASGSTLDMLTIAGKTFAGSFTNSGTVNWSQGDIELAGGANIINNGVWRALDDDGRLVPGAGDGTFTNTGIFRKTGIGLTTIIAPFVNSGTIDAAGVGQIHFEDGATFNDGTSFIGAGKTFVADASFNGAISSTNLNFADGTYTGTGAGVTLSGSATIFTGGFDGIWSIASGSTLDIRGLPDKSFAGDFTNNGTVNWSQGDIELAGGGNVANRGLWIVYGDDDIVQGSGGGTFTNSVSGVFRKTGDGNTQLAAGFVNRGRVDVEDGAITLPTNFVNQGTLAGTGGYTLSGTLGNLGIIAPGADGSGIGTLSLKGDYIQAPTGRLDIQFGPGGIADEFLISGMAQLGGSLRLFCASCSFNVGDLFTILDSVDDLTGTFANSSATGFDPGFAYSILYDQRNTRVQVRIDNLGMPTPMNSVPEPATWAMLLLGFGFVGGAQRRRHRVART